MDSGSSPSKWITKSSTLHADCRIFGVQKHHCMHPIDKREGDFFVIDSTDWVNVLAITKNKEVIFVRQYRFGTQHLSWEIPGGIIENNESAIIAGPRELDEETGYIGDKPTILGKCHPNPALFNNICHFILIENAELKNNQNLDCHEEIEIQLVPIDNAMNWITSQKEPIHAMTLNGLFFARNKLEK